MDCIALAILCPFTECNKRKKDNNGKHVSWEEHLRIICVELGHDGSFKQRRESILMHHREGEYAYPPLSDNEKQSIKVMAESLYSSIKTEIEKSLALYAKLTDAVVVKDTDSI